MHQLAVRLVNALTPESICCCTNWPVTGRALCNHAAGLLAHSSEQNNSDNLLPSPTSTLVIKANSPALKCLQQPDACGVGSPKQPGNDTALSAGSWTIAHSVSCCSRHSGTHSLDACSSCLSRATPTSHCLRTWSKTDLIYRSKPYTSATSAPAVVGGGAVQCRSCSNALLAPAAAMTWAC